MVTNFHKFSKWVCRGMVKSFLLGILSGCPKALQNTLLKYCLLINIYLFYKRNLLIMLQGVSVKFDENEFDQNASVILLQEALGK